MKKLTTLLLTLLLTASVWAQSPQKMSYQAVIRNASNTLVTNTAIGMRISILQTTSTGTAVYVETQTPTTNANGLVSIEIGGGTVVTGIFSAIDWSSGPYFIKTETDPAGGITYTITGTSQLLSVPYALSAGNVTGLEKIIEGTNTGWRLIGQNPANYGNIGAGATDLSYSYSASTTRGATGAGSLAMGENTTASNSVSTAMGYGTTASYYYTTAMGRETTASNWYSTAIGYLTTASGSSSTAMGEHTTASGYYTTAMGNNTTANALASTAIGRYNIGGGSTYLWNLTDPLFEIGNGNVGTPSNALTVLKNGTIIAPSLTNLLITTAGAKALITKEYADTKLTPTGLEKITEGTNTGWRLIGQNPANYGNIGAGATDLSYSTGTSASTTKGATGSYATAMGRGTKANAYASTAIGRYNLGGGTAIAIVLDNPLFEVGNGFSGARSNAFTVFQNGNADVNGVFRAQKNVWPTTGVGVEIAYDNALGIGYVQTYDRNTASWKDLAFGALNVTPVSNNFTSLGTSTKKWTAVYAVNGTIQTSDRRLKKDINNINYGLNTVMKLRPVSYKWKKGNQDVNLGLIAQDVQKLIPEMVDIGTDKDKTLGLKYTELIPVLIKGMQEQQKEIEELKKMVNKLLKQKIVVSN